jgi:hypothetical protein
MGHITKIAGVKNATAIWEYDPTHEDNRVLGGSLDVIAAIRTLAIKVSAGMYPRSPHLIRLLLLRSKRLDSASNTSRALKPSVDFLTPATASGKLVPNKYYYHYQLRISRFSSIRDSYVHVSHPLKYFNQWPFTTEFCVHSYVAYPHHWFHSDL